MNERPFFLENLITKAKEKNDTKLIKKLEDKKFLDSFNDICSVFENLNLEVIEKSEGDFDYKKDINLRISRALARNYFTMYYVNLSTGEYVGYSSSCDYKSLIIDESGTDFFADTLKNAQDVIYEPDFEKVTKSITKENLINNTKDGKTFDLIYRLLIKGKPTYVSLKALKLADEDNNIIIGISNIDEQKKDELKYKAALEQNITYYNIALSLVQNYFDLYYINVDTNAYIEYSINSQNQSLDKVSSGIDFFQDTKVNALKLIVPEDQQKFLKSLERENLLHEINNGKVFTLTYRVLLNNIPTYCQLTAINLINDVNHVILAVSNIDARKKKELEYAERLEYEKRIARTDGLTGAKNKFSYNEAEKTVNEAIKNGNIIDFAVLICDINDLKLINDNYGHDAGDNIIKEAADLLISTFKNSNVFRIGGDEFVIILEGSDYYKRDYLVNNIKESNKKHIDNGLVLAWGYADYDKDSDKSVIDVFKRADINMYENKKYLKARKK